MLSHKQSAVVIGLTIFSLFIGMTGCRRHSDHVSPNRSSSNPKSTSTNLHPSVHHAAFLKSPDRDSPFTTYNNPDYSLSFRYPRTYSLTEDHEDFDDASSLKSQDQLAADQPGLLLLVSVEIPDDAYPNTTFSSGHLQFAVNPTASEPVCRALAAPDDPDSAEVSGLRDGAGGVSSSPRESTGVEAIHGLLFHWRQSHTLLNHMDYHSRDYFAYSNNSCFEFFLEVSDTVPLDPEPIVKPAETQKILHVLERIVSTFQLHSQAHRSSLASNH